MKVLGSPWFWVAAGLTASHAYVYTVAGSRANKAALIREAKMVAVAAEKKAEYERQAGQLSRSLESPHRERIRTIRAASAATQKVILDYVPSPTDTTCRLSRGFRVLHDAAASGEPLPPATSGHKQSDPGLDEVAVAGAVDRNYSACREAITEVTTWREWHARQSELAAKQKE